MNRMIWLVAAVVCLQTSCSLVDVDPSDGQSFPTASDTTASAPSAAVDGDPDDDAANLDFDTDPPPSSTPETTAVAAPETTALAEPAIAVDGDPQDEEVDLRELRQLGGDEVPSLIGCDGAPWYTQAAMTWIDDDDSGWAVAVRLDGYPGEIEDPTYMPGWDGIAAWFAFTEEPSDDPFAAGEWVAVSDLAEFVCPGWWQSWPGEYDTSRVRELKVIGAAMFNTPKGRALIDRLGGW